MKDTTKMPADSPNHAHAKIAQIDRLLFDWCLTHTAGRNISQHVDDRICISLSPDGQKHQWHSQPEAIATIMLAEPREALHQAEKQFRH